MAAFILWYLTLTLAGWLAFPLLRRLLPHLSDRGYGLSRSAGLLLWGFLFWLLCSFKILQNNAGGILLALVLLAVASLLSLRGGGWAELRAWVRENRRTILTVEILFLVSFAFMAFVRANNPDISGTEKPMELAFINAILQSPTFPPHDPWLSGYAISYYYFGYVLVAMLATITGTPGGVAFNLGVALVFALTALNAYSLLYSLLSRRFTSLEARGNRLARRGALLAPLFILLVSNLEGLLEVLHAGGLFWRQSGDTFVSPFWKWLDIQELVNPPSQPFSWVPNRPTGIWWWRASRVLQDYDLAGHSKEIIDEFPFFSFLLADLHPHVLAMPFAVLAAALAFNFYLQARQNPLPAMGALQWLAAWMKNEGQPFAETRLARWLVQPGFWLAAIVLGGLAFLNTWDFPIYVGLYSAAYVLGRYQDEGWNGQRIFELLENAVLLIVAGVLLYLPFYIGFSSQAGGILPSLSFSTRGVHLWVMFAPLLIPIFVWLFYLWAWRGSRNTLVTGLKFGLGLTFGFWLASFLLAWLILVVLSNIDRFMPLRDLFFNLHGSPAALTILLDSFARRIQQPGAWLTLALALVLVWGLYAGYRHKSSGLTVTGSAEGQPPSLSGSTVGNSFALLLVLLGTGLVLFPEFFYLRDQFGWRMNTIFKFYYQAWIVWALAASYATVVLITSLTGWKGIVYRVVTVLLLGSALIYPTFGLLDRAFNPWVNAFAATENGSDFRAPRLTLDGTDYFRQYQPAEMEAIDWLKAAPPGVVAEAVGGSYSPSFHTRVSTLSGKPSVLGWPGHESQWRGGAEEMGSRESDLSSLYHTRSWDEAAEIITRYNIRYIYIGSLEQTGYRVEEDKFQQYMKPVYSNNGVVIYEVPEYLQKVQP